MTETKRIQRKRTRGWRTPENTVYVGRPTKWGNPYVVFEAVKDGVTMYKAIERNCKVPGIDGYTEDAYQALQEVIRLYENWVKRQVKAKKLDLAELEGKNLSCWCNPGQPCHVDVLLRLANTKYRIRYENLTTGLKGAGSAIYRFFEDAQAESRRSNDAYREAGIVHWVEEERNA